MTRRTLSFDDLVRGGALEVGDGYRAKNEELGGNGPIFLRGAYLQDDGFRITSPDRFLTQDVSNFGGKVARVGDVVVTTKGNSTGRVGRIREAEAGSIYSPHLSYWRSRDAEIVDQSFLYYWSRSPEFRSQLNAMSAGTDMAPYLSLRDQMRLRVSLPRITQQRAVGKVLNALDDKIYLNRRMNETLEAMARAIFKDWFVDFGPVRSKAEGAKPYLESEVWALFPARLDDDGQPEGWSETTLAQYAALNPESWSHSTYPSCIRYVDLSGAKWGRVQTVESYGRTDAPSRAQRILRPGDSIVGTVRPANGSFALIHTDGLTGSTGFAVLRPRQEWFREFVYLAATAPENIERLGHLADGAAYPAVRPEVVISTAVVAAPGAVLQAFSRIAGPLLNRMSNNDAETETLAATRDLLLPKLISGELRVRQAEKIAEAEL